MAWILPTLIATVAHAEETLSLWDRQPAEVWATAFPLGNGRLGAMVFGSAPRERLRINEESLWAGEPFDVYPDDYARHLKTLQQRVLSGQIMDAQKFGMAHLTATPTSFRSYEPLADLWIDYGHAAPTQEYRRELDLQKGLVRVQYRAGGIRYTREILVSVVDDLLAVRMSADKPGSIRATVRLTREKDVNVSAPAADRLHLDGQIVDVPAPQAYDDNPGGSGPGGEHMRFAGRLLARPTGGTLSAEGDRLMIEGADEVLLLFTGATDFNLDRMSFDRSIDPGKVANGILEKVTEKPWNAILRDHVREHRSVFDRVSIDLGASNQDQLPTDERLAAVKNGAEDAGLAALYFQFGRYLLMSSSRRPGRIPANLQGIWSDKMWAAWEADFHLNINFQMNYWPADLCNLSETMDPLTDWFERVTEKGATSARKLYDADGWVAFLSVNLFGRTTPAGSTIASQFQNSVLDPLAGAWMAMAFWRHYTFTLDEPFLREHAYPILKGACAFLLDYLVEDQEGQLTIVPSTSPENSYLDPDTGRAVRITQASTYHVTIVRAVFEATIRASEILHTDDDFRHRLERALEKLPPIKVGRDGTIQEWFKDFEEAEPGHRHMSHLLGLHPFAHITPRSPELFDAARRTIERRLSHGGGQAGWSRAWIVNFYARLLDGEAAHQNVLMLLRSSTRANLFDDRPPFQVDVHFGGTSGIAEMLLQSHAGEIHLLPALPKAWPTGHVHGLKARGGFIVDIDWANGKLSSGRIRSESGGLCRVRCSIPFTVNSDGHNVDIRTPEPLVGEFGTEAGRVYNLNVQ